MDFKLRGQVKDSATPERLIAKWLTHFGLVPQPNTPSAIWSRGQPPTGRTGTARRWGRGINESPDLCWPEACAGLGSSDTPVPRDPVTLLVNTATRPRPPFQVSPWEAQLQPELSRDPWPQSAPRDWAQDTQQSRAACPGFLWTTCGASGLAQKRARTAGSWTGLWGTTPTPLRPLRQPGSWPWPVLSWDRKRDPGWHFKSKRQM